jgi:iron(III) transport system ATP-binding protein
MTDPTIECTTLSKYYQNQSVVENINLSVQNGDILALVGPSGCGKTTTLRMLAGFEQPDSGQISMYGKVVVDQSRFTPPEKRRIGVVFQEYALFPHLNVRQNVAFGLNRMPSSDRKQLTTEMLTLAGLERLGERYPHEISGGERQRVALARALAPQPVVLLLDEPFSNLDAELRLKLREDVRSLLKKLKMTAVFVTHDQEEALFMGDQLAVMSGGRIHQVGTPEEIFAHPADRFVAEFMGDANFLPGVVTAGGIQTEIGLVEQRLDLPSGAPVEIAVRADDIAFDPMGQANAKVVARKFKGVINVYHVELASGLVIQAFQPHYSVFQVGMPVRVWPDPGHDLACFYQGKALKA